MLTRNANNCFCGPGLRRTDGSLVVDVTNIRLRGDDSGNEVALATYKGSVFLLVFVNMNGDDVVNYLEYEYLELRL